jgi:hypothetical protein
VKEQAARTQKVDAALEVSKLGAQLVVTEH